MILAVLVRRNSRCRGFKR